MLGERSDLEHIVSILEGVHSKLDVLLLGQQHLTLISGPSVKDTNLKKRHVHDKIRIKRSDGSIEARNACMELDQHGPQKILVHLDDDEILGKRAVAEVDSVVDIADTMRPRRGNTPTYANCGKEKMCDDGDVAAVRDFHTGQDVSLNGTGMWAGKIFHATIVDIRDTDDTIKVRYSDESYQRFSRKAFKEAFVSSSAEALRLPTIIKRKYTDNLGSDSASGTCVCDELSQTFSGRFVSPAHRVRSVRIFSGQRQRFSFNRLTLRTDLGLLSDRCVWIMRLPPLQKCSKHVLFFDFLGMLILLKDCILVPYALALVDTYYFSTSFHFILSIISTAFWTSDLLLKFVTSQDDVDFEISNVKNSAMHYLKRWFMVDFSLVALDWLICALEASEGASPSRILKAVKFLKIARMVRAVVVIRGHRVNHLEHTIRQRVRFLDRIWSILRLLIFVLWVNHSGACAWIFLASGVSHGDSWEVQIAEAHVVGARTFADANLGWTFRYTMAYYLSLSTMFGGASAVIPKTHEECWFVSALVLCGVLFVTTFFSSTSAMLMREAKANQRRTAEMNKLRLFLRQHKIHRHLCFLIQRQSAKRFEMETRISEEEVLGISSLSIELRDQLKYNLYEPVLRGQPLWRACAYVDDQIIQAMCIFAISFKMYATGEVVFEEKSHVEAAFTLVWGSMTYSRSCAQERRSPLRLKFVPGDTACEHALWIEWEAVGILEAVARCEVLVCSSKGMEIVMQNVSFQMQSIISGYAKAVSDFFMLEHETASLSDVSTIAEYEAIVTFMPADSRMDMSRPALTALKKDALGHNLMVSRSLTMSWKLMDSTIAHSGSGQTSVSMTREQLFAIESQLCDGKCNLGVDESGRVLRIFRAVVMSLQRGDGSICVQVGETIDGTSKVKIRLPRRKIRMGETVKECSQLMIREYFAALVSHVDLKYGELDMELKQSQSYSIPTKCMRYTVTALIHDTGPRVGTSFHEGALGDEAIECFALHCPARSSVIIYAWMFDHQLDYLKESEALGEDVAASWINMFTATDIARTRQGIRWI